MKKIALILILISTSSAVFGKRLADKPEFEDNYIKMKADFWLCGGVTLTPKPDTIVRVMSQRFSQSFTGDTIIAGEVLSEAPIFGKKKKKSKNGSYWAEIPAGGMRVRYDHAGIRPSHHYRVFCQIQNKRGNWEAAKCSEVLTIDAIRHNKGCVIGPAGPKAEYAPLNMKT